MNTNKIYKGFKAASVIILIALGFYCMIVGSIMLNGDHIPNWVTPPTITQIGGFCYLYNGMLFGVVSYFINYPWGKHENKDSQRGRDAFN